MFHLDSFHPIPNTYRSEARRRRSFNQIDGIKQSFKPSRPGFFSPAAEGHVAAVDRQGIEIVKFKLKWILSRIGGVEVDGDGGAVPVVVAELEDGVRQDAWITALFSHPLMTG